MLPRFLSHKILNANVRNDLYSLQHSLFMMVFNVPMNLWLHQWWYYWKMNFRGWMSEMTSWFKWCLDLTADMLLMRFNPYALQYESSLDFGITDLVSSCTAWINTVYTVADNTGYVYMHEDFYCWCGYSGFVLTFCTCNNTE